MKIAVLALQGAFAEHEKMLARLGVEFAELRQKSHLRQRFDGLIIPGGESTAQGKLLRELDMMEPLRQKILDGLPVFGTCAGLILLAKRTNDGPTHLATMDIAAVRNAYGRQLGSFFTEGLFADDKIPMTFIRAPYIESVAEDVQVLSVCDGKIVAARQNNMLVTSFHPELNDDPTVHKYFLNMVGQ